MKSSGIVEKINVKCKIQIGSEIFFNCYSDYKLKDKDYIIFTDDYDFLHIRLDKTKEDLFIFRECGKEQFIKSELNRCKIMPMVAGKFLCKELCDYLHITIDDIKQFDFAFKNIDEKHSYEKIIFDAYIQNNDFYLTDEQRNLAYKNYKLTRKK